MELISVLICGKIAATLYRREHANANFLKTPENSLE